MDLGVQVGRVNGIKIGPKRDRKDDETKKGNKMAKKSQEDSLTALGCVGPGPGGGVLPEGRRRGGKEQSSILNHPATGAGGIKSSQNGSELIDSTTKI